MKHSKGIPMALIITLVLLVQLVGSAAAGAPNAFQSAPSQSGVVDGAGGAVGQHTSIQVDDEGQTRISYYDSGNGDLK